VHVGLAEHDGARTAQLPDDRRVLFRHEPLQRGGPGGVGQAGDMDVVLDHDRDAVQRALPLARLRGGVGRARGPDRARLVQGDERVERLARLRLLDERARELLAGDLAPADLRRRFRGGERGGTLRRRAGSKRTRERAREPAAGRDHPRPTNGIFVAITVMNWTLASSGRVAM
jgi:hypothetical protein